MPSSLGGLGSAVDIPPSAADHRGSFFLVLSGQWSKTVGTVGLGMRTDAIISADSWPSWSLALAREKIGEEGEISAYRGPMGGSFCWCFFIPPLIPFVREGMASSSFVLRSV